MYRLASDLSTLSLPSPTGTEVGLLGLLGLLLRCSEGCAEGLIGLFSEKDTGLLW